MRAGKVRYVGCSNLTGWQIAAFMGAMRSSAAFVSLQPEHSLIQRGSERELVPACDHFGLGILPWSPLGGGFLTGKYAPGAPMPAGSRGEIAMQGPYAASWADRLNDWAHAIVDAVREAATSLGKTPAQVALRWVMDSPGITAPILGATKLTQIDDNLGVLGWTLPADVYDRLDRVSAIDLGYPYAVRAARWLDAPPSTR